MAPRDQFKPIRIRETLVVNYISAVLYLLYSVRLFNKPTGASLCFRSVCKEDLVKVLNDYM